jgi:hypothetical protein
MPSLYNFSTVRISIEYHLLIHQIFSINHKIFSVSISLNFTSNLGYNEFIKSFKISTSVSLAQEISNHFDTNLNAFEFMDFQSKQFKNCLYE